MAEGAVVYVLVKDASGDPSRVVGRLIEEKGDTAVVATLPSEVSRISQTLKAKAPGDGEKIAFLRVPRTAFSSVVPAGWKTSVVSQLPSTEKCFAAWGELGQEVLISSEAEKPSAPPPATKKLKGLEEDLLQMSQLWDGGDSEESESSDSNGPRQPRKDRRGKGHLPPGSRPSSSKDRPEMREDPKNDDMAKMMQKMMTRGLAESQSPQEMLPYMMMSLLMSRDKSKRRKKSRKDRSSPGGSSSDESSSEDSEHHAGMKAVSTLHKLQKRITRHPQRIIRDFEKEVVEDLGVTAGQAWTLKDYMKKQYWGKFKGIFRCAMMDVQAYEYLRSGQTSAATAQLVQNMKCKIQAVIQGGNWDSAWLLTGIPDPMSRREFGGSKEEMAIVSEYVNALAKLRKRVKETAHHGGGGDEEDQDGAHRAK
jgi:hypothetical protein